MGIGRGWDEAAIRNEGRHRDDLASGRTRFTSWPLEAHLQMSTFCDVSCVMCWDGANPPTTDASEATLAGVGRLVDRGLRLLVPHDGSEPLARGWSRTHEFARGQAIALEVTTNAQTLTTSKLEAALDVLDHLVVSLDSHIPALLEQIRPGLDARRTFANVAAAVHRCRRAAIPVTANVVLLAMNLETVHDTVRWLAELGIDAVTVIRLKSVNGRSDHLDPERVHGAAAVALAAKRARAVAEEVGVDLAWCLDDEPLGRPSTSPPTHLRGRLHQLDQRLSLDHPGYCRFARSSLRVRADGSTAPCGYAAQGELDLGNLALDDPDDVWNGPSAQDLRRSMLTRDLPRLCTTCIHAQDPLPLADHPILDDLPAGASAAFGRVVAPRGVIRSDAAPSVALEGVAASVRDVALLVEGPNQADAVELAVPTRGPHRLRIDVPEWLWGSLPPYTARWFTAVGTGPDGRRERVVHGAWALVRAPHLPRISGSALRYDDDRPVAREVHLGAEIPVRARRR